MILEGADSLLGGVIAVDTRGGGVHLLFIEIVDYGLLVLVGQFLKVGSEAAGHKEAMGSLVCK